MNILGASDFVSSLEDAPIAENNIESAMESNFPGPNESQASYQ